MIPEPVLPTHDHDWRAHHAAFAFQSIQFDLGIVRELVQSAGRDETTQLLRQIRAVVKEWEALSSLTADRDDAFQMES